jgi:hypothetical protein
LKTIITRTAQTANKNSTNILAALAVSGVVYTAYLAAKGGGDARLLEVEADGELTKRERFDLTWRCYIPAAISGTATVTFIITANRVGAHKTAAVAAAYSISEKAFHEYREKVIDEIGKNKEEIVRGEAAKEILKDTPPPKEVIVGTGEVLCCELFTKRYFLCNMEKLRQAENKINADINNGVYATLGDLYDLIGLPYTSASDVMGWDTDKHLKLNITSIVSEDGRPCLAFEYDSIKFL